MNPVLRKVLTNIPEVKKPETKPNFSVKLKWTLITLVLFFILGQITLYGINQETLISFEYFSQVLATEVGSLVTLGIGPIVEASIILQLANGTGLLKIDSTTQEGKKLFQGLQKTLAIIFVLIGSFGYVLLGGIGTGRRNKPINSNSDN